MWFIFYNLLTNYNFFFVHGIIIKITPMQLSFNTYLKELQKGIVSIILEVVLN